MKSATLFCVVGALSVCGAGCAIARCIVLPSVRAVGAHTAERDWLISCSHFSYIDNCIIFVAFVTVPAKQRGIRLRNKIYREAETRHESYDVFASVWLRIPVFWDPWRLRQHFSSKHDETFTPKRSATSLKNENHNNQIFFCSITMNRIFKIQFTTLVSFCQ
jgi:hypothetical protein